MKLFQGNQRKIIKETFRHEPLFKLCGTIHEVFQGKYPSIILTKEQLFADSAEALDEILTSESQESMEFCKDLWIQTINNYREREGDSCGMDTTMVEVAMLHYALMFALTTVNHSFYRQRLQKMIHNSVHKLFGKNSSPEIDESVHKLFGKNLSPEKDKCLEIEKMLKTKVNELTIEMNNWMQGYFESEECLTEQIEEVINPSRKNKQSNKSKEKPNKLYTLDYKCKNQEREVRIDIIRRKWEEWGWIKKNTDVDDFSAFFKGTPRDCNLKWIGKLSILNMLLKELLKMKDCFGKATGLSARSIIVNQFKTSYDSHSERIDDQENIKINLSLWVLNYHEPLGLPRNNNNIYDIRDSVMVEVYNQRMRITKDINKEI